jgi:type IV secretion system protein VirB8
MNSEQRQRADDYYRRAGSWADDGMAQLRRSRQIAWIVAIIAVLVAVIEALSIWAMVPLRTVVPYTLLVDRHTGYVEAMKPLEAGLLAPDKALTQSFLVQYVLAREGFDRATIRDDYRKVALWSAEPARSQYVAGMATTNLDNPAARAGNRAVIAVRVRSVSALQQDSALVRFETQLVDQERPATSRQYWVAVVRFRYSPEPMATEDRYINPLGFQVTSYRRSPETLPSEPAEQRAADTTSPQYFGTGIPALQRQAPAGDAR